MMRRSLRIIPILFMVALAVPCACADASPPGTYTLECIGPCASDPTVTFSTTRISFTVFGNTVDFTGLSLTPADLYGWNIENGKLSLTDVTEDGSLVLVPVTLAFATSNEGGLFLPAPAPSPEPSLIGLTLLGLACLFAVRKRFGSRFSQAN